MSRQQPLLVMLLLISPQTLVAESKTISYQDALQSAMHLSIERRRNDNNKRLANLERRMLDSSADARLSVTASIGPKDTGSGFSSKDTHTFEESYGAQAQQTLWDFGRLNASKTKADLQIKIQELRNDETLHAIRWTVTRAFLKVLSSIDLLQITKDQLNNAQVKRNLTFGSYKSGLRPEYDLARAEADLGRARLAYLKAQNDFETSKTFLAPFLSPADTATESLDTSFSVKGNLHHDPKKWQSFYANWKTFEPIPAAKTRAVNRELIKSDLLAVEAKLYPTVGAGVSFSLAKSWPLPTEKYLNYRRSLGAQLLFAWDIPWNGAENDERERVALKAVDLDLQDNSETRLRAEKAALARKQIDLSLLELAANEQQKVFIEKSFALLRKKYEVGSASATEVSAAEDEFINNRLDRVRLNNTVAAAVVDLAEAIGVNDLAKLFE